MAQTPAQKKAFLKWKDGHLDKWREYCKGTSATYYEKNKIAHSKNSLARYHYKRISEEFRNILL